MPLPLQSEIMPPSWIINFNPDQRLTLLEVVLCTLNQETEWRSAMELRWMGIWQQWEGLIKHRSDNQFLVVVLQQHMHSTDNNPWGPTTPLSQSHSCKSTRGSLICSRILPVGRPWVGPEEQCLCVTRPLLLPQPPAVSTPSLSGALVGWIHLLLSNVLRCQTSRWHYTGVVDTLVQFNICFHQ